MEGFSIFNEDSYEKSIIAIFENLGFNYYYGPNIERDYTNPLFLNDLDNIYVINRDSDREAIKNALSVNYSLTRPIPSSSRHILLTK